MIKANWNSFEIFKKFYGMVYTILWKDMSGICNFMKRLKLLENCSMFFQIEKTYIYQYCHK